jgi:hypothetical protein
MKLRGAINLALFTTVVLWVTGVVTVPFSGRTAMELAPLFGVEDEASRIMLEYQLENMIYAVGRVPLLLATFVAYGMWIKE